VALWILAFAITGGINTWLAQGGFTIFRAGNRYSIHLLALALLGLSAWGSRRFLGRKTGFQLLLVVPLTALGLWDQLPARPGDVTQSELRRLPPADRRSVATLADRLPPGALIFQLPVTPFPEAGPRGAMTDYEHLRPYLHTDELRFSYGSLGGAISQRWAQRMSELAASALVDRLSEAGFDALWIDRRAYADNAAGLKEDMLRLGLAEIMLPDSPHLHVFRLPPATKTSLPDLTEIRWYDPWNSSHARAGPSVHAAAGWYGEENAPARHWRWAGRRGVLGLWNDTPETRAIRLTFRTVCVGAGTLEVHYQGTPIARWAVSDATPVNRTLELMLPAGSSRLELTFTGVLIEPEGDRRNLGFAVENLILESR
jgi:hypothetical protein